MTGKVSAINCTNCGAGLEVLGGGRVVTQVCGYCGARLDATDAYAVLSVHAAVKRPETPFRLGLTGDVDGIPFTIIGMLELEEQWDGTTSRWIDHILYSPTHGYAWLTLEDGHTLLTRKVRDWPSRRFLTAHAVERAETRPDAYWRGESYTYYATTNWQIRFVEGEFTWRPEVGQRGSSVSLMPSGKASQMLTYLDGQEREIETTRYFPEAAAAFGVEAPRPQGVHPLQPYESKPGRRFYAIWFAAMTAACLAIALLVSATSGAVRTLYAGAPNALPQQLAFEVASTVRPVRLEFYQDLHQAWAEYDITLTDPSGQVLAETGRGISYYYGGSGEDAWSEGSRYSALTFQPTQAGAYALDVALAGGEGAAARSNMRLTVQEGRGASRWAWFAMAAFTMALLWTLSSSWRHRMARWRGSDWTDEDDD